MPSLEVHLKNSEKRLGKANPVHYWMDSPEIPYITRLRRHSPFSLKKNKEEVRKLYGEEGVKEYFEHLREDMPAWICRLFGI